MTDRSLAEQVASESRALQSTFSELQSAVHLSNLRDALEDLGTTITGLPQKIKEIRARGYVFDKPLEEKAQNLAERWSPLRNEVQQEITQQATRLQYEIQPVERLVTEALASQNDPGRAQPLLAQAKAAVSTLQGKAQAAEQSIRGTYDQFQQEVQVLSSRLTELTGLMQQVAEASFQLLAGEGAIACVKATWIQGDKESRDDPKGLLLLTDQRLLFEQKQEVATKKVLFITTQKQRVQKLLLEVALPDLAGAQASKQGLLGHEDHLLVTATNPSWRQSGHWHLDGRDCRVWAGLVNRARAGEYASEHIAFVPTAVAPPPVIPEKCPGCGGTLPPNVARGATSITCSFCGRVIRL